MARNRDINAARVQGFDPRLGAEPFANLEVHAWRLGRICLRQCVNQWHGPSRAVDFQRSLRRRRRCDNEQRSGRGKRKSNLKHCLPRYSSDLVQVKKDRVARTALYDHSTPQACLFWGQKQTRSGGIF